MTTENRSINDEPETNGLVLQRHTMWEDVYGMVVGIVFVALGIALLKAAGLVTGGVAGIALLLSYLLPFKVGTIFTLVNLPFFLFAWIMMGRQFAIKSTIASAGVTLLLGMMPNALELSFISPLFAALAGGTTCGMGVLALARHGAGVGGTGIVTLWLYRHRGINAGYSQICIDSVIMLAAFTVIPSARVAWSVLSAVAISGMVMAWHRPGRYNGY